MIDKHYIDAQALLEDSIELGARILESGFKPNFIVGVWRGGSPVGIVVQELLDYFGVDTDHISIRTSSYSAVGERGTEVRVHGLSYLIKNINWNNSLLLVDDVFDSGRSLEAVIDTLKMKARRNTPRDIRIATVYYKPENNQTAMEPDYFIHRTDKWLVFPHEIEGMGVSEIFEHKPGWGGVVSRLKDL